MKMANDNPTRLPVYLLPGIAALLYAVLVSIPAFADNIEEKLPSGITAKANFHVGLASRPAVLILHGFLQTGHSPPMGSLAGNLASKGYTVLNPTMTLGINRRNQSMACEAVHAHTMNDEVAELDYWVKWLGKKGYKEIVLTGFSSTGNHAALEYVAQKSHPAIKLLILTNINPMHTGHAGHTKIHPAASGSKLTRFNMGYCKNNFTATADSYLSYAKFDESTVLGLMKKVMIPTEVILGSADTVLPPNWADRIQALQSRAQIRIIKNANHFFEGTQEFDLAEEVEIILKNITLKQL